LRHLRNILFLKLLIFFIDAKLTPDLNNDNIKGSLNGKQLQNTFPLFLYLPIGAQMNLTVTIDLDDHLVNDVPDLLDGAKSPGGFCVWKTFQFFLKQSGSAKGGGNGGLI
jgi:hypothetical protein